METENRKLKREIETLRCENAELRETNNKLKQSAGTESELRRQLSRTIEQLSQTRTQLLDVRDRLTVTEQVTEATQRRELQQEAASHNLPPESIYEELRSDNAQLHVYAKLQTGW